MLTECHVIDNRMTNTNFLNPSLLSCHSYDIRLTDDTLPESYKSLGIEDTGTEHTAIKVKKKPLKKKKIGAQNELNHTVFPIVYVNGISHSTLCTYVIGDQLWPIKLVNMQLL